jgi:hypothetical protein
VKKDTFSSFRSETTTLHFIHVRAPRISLTIYFVSVTFKPPLANFNEAAKRAVPALSPSLQTVKTVFSRSHRPTTTLYFECPCNNVSPKKKKHLLADYSIY